MFRRRHLIPGLAALLLLAAGCGPRADNPTGGGVDLGTAPRILTIPSYADVPSPSLDGGQVVFSVRYHVEAHDEDKNMRAVQIVVDYADPCDGTTPEFRLDDDLPSDDWVKPDISVDQTTVDQVRVPLTCYPISNLFNIDLRVRDTRGNLSNLLHNQVQVSASQGPGSP